MLGLFDDPFDTSYYYRRRPYYGSGARYTYDPFFGLQVQRPAARTPRRVYYDPFSMMLDPLGYMYGFYDDDADDNEEKEKKQDKKAETQAPKKEEEAKPASSKEEEKKEETSPAPAAEKYWSRSSVFSAHSRGGIEEIREKSYDSTTGETTETSTRRIGDRWCRVDTTTTKDGHSVSKETWHNVSADEMEHFKLEWTQRHGGMKQEFGALKDGSEKKSEEPKKEEEAAPAPAETPAPAPAEEEKKE